MDFVIGFLVWLAIGLIAAAVAHALYRGPETARPLTFAFGILGAFIGGMLGVSGYIFNRPEPLRFGGLLGAVLGAVFFAFLYHFTARRVL